MKARTLIILIALAFAIAGCNTNSNEITMDNIDSIDPCLIPADSELVFICDPTVSVDSIIVPDTTE